MPRLGALRDTNILRRWRDVAVTSAATKVRPVTICEAETWWIGKAIGVKRRVNRETTRATHALSPNHQRAPARP